MAKGLPKSIIAKYGISKKAWEVFRGRRAPKKKKATTLGKRKVSKTRRVYVRAKRVGRRAKGFGGFNLKELLFGAAFMTGGKIAVNMVAPGVPFKRQLGTIAGGAAASITGLPGKRLISYGLIDAASDLITGVVGGSLGGTTGGGYDF